MADLIMVVNILQCAFWACATERYWHSPGGSTGVVYIWIMQNSILDSSYWTYLKKTYFITVGMLFLGLHITT